MTPSNWVLPNDVPLELEQDAATAFADHQVERILWAGSLEESGMDRLLRDACLLVLLFGLAKASQPAAARRVLERALRDRDRVSWLDHPEWRNLQPGASQDAMALRLALSAALREKHRTAANEVLGRALNIFYNAVSNHEGPDVAGAYVTAEQQLIDTLYKEIETAVDDREKGYVYFLEWVEDRRFPLMVPDPPEGRLPADNAAYRVFRDLVPGVEHILISHFLAAAPAARRGKQRTQDGWVMLRISDVVRRAGEQEWANRSPDSADAAPYPEGSWEQRLYDQTRHRVRSLRDAEAHMNERKAIELYAPCGNGERMGRWLAAMAQADFVVALRYLLKD